ncbi:MAG: hypothetical protein QM733_13240 [Ilumatobacteraceae bacterium]
MSSDRVGASTVIERVAALDAGAVGDVLVDRRGIAADGVDHRRGHGQAGHRAGGAGGEHGPAALLGGHGGGDGDVDAAVEVLGDRHAGEHRHRIRVQPGVEQPLPGRP